ncbi:MAG: hypothetical protein ACI4O0_05725, partial [Candidatus Limivicinus sp.]
VGGTARAALRLSQKLFGLPDSCRTITRSQFDTLAQRLCKSDQDAAQLILRYAPERIHTLVPGILVLQYILKQYQVSELTVSRYGAREGYLRRVVQPRLQ